MHQRLKFVFGQAIVWTQEGVGFCHGGGRLRPLPNPLLLLVEARKPKLPEICLSAFKTQRFANAPNTDANPDSSFSPSSFFLKARAGLRS